VKNRFMEARIAFDYDNLDQEHRSVRVPGKRVAPMRPLSPRDARQYIRSLQVDYKIEDVVAFLNRILIGRRSITCG
jgi:hypothetical protein